MRFGVEYDAGWLVVVGKLLWCMKLLCTYRTSPVLWETCISSTYEFSLDCSSCKRMQVEYVYMMCPKTELRYITELQRYSVVVICDMWYIISRCSIVTICAMLCFIYWVHNVEVLRSFVGASPRIAHVWLWLMLSMRTYIACMRIAYVMRMKHTR